MPISEVRMSARRCFKLIPDEVILDMGTREFDMNQNSSCVCGWAFRSGMQNLGENYNYDNKYTVDDEGISIYSTDEKCRRLFGGDAVDWERVYYGVVGVEAGDECVHDPADVEIEFVNRFHKALERA